MQEYLLEKAWLPGGWASDVHIRIDAAGDIATLTSGSQDRDLTRIPGLAIPGIPNTHCHAFQRALSGLTEFSGQGEDNFWSWREMMYALAGRISVDDVYGIAAQLYMEMLEAGYTSVAEFHYLHHLDADSQHAQAAAMALLRAARDTGIGLTLLPTLYMSSAFGKQPLLAQQARFYHSAEDFCALLGDLSSEFSDDRQNRLGCAFHSLRAVPPDALEQVLQYVDRNFDGPLHMHIAEQLREVEDCLAWSGQRPVQWLLDHHALDARWCLVHATHIDDSECHALAASGAVVSLCPTTEANLGDGLFPLPRYLDHGGQIAIGSDSNVSVNPVEELRWLEYAQRLALHRRNIVTDPDDRSCGSNLLRRVLRGGAQACARKIAVLAPGYRADIVILDAESSCLLEKPQARLLDSFVFSGNDRPVKDVMSGGRWLVRDGRHRDHANIKRAYKASIARLYRDLAAAHS